MPSKLTRLHEYGNETNTFNVLLNNDGTPNGFSKFSKQYSIGDPITCMIHGKGIVVDIKTKNTTLGKVNSLIVQKLLDICD